MPRFRVGQWLALTIGILLAFAIAGIGAALLANHRLNVQRGVVLSEVEPALLAALKLENALINKETGVRGYIITGNTRSLEPYEEGERDEAGAYRALERPDVTDDALLARDVQAIHARVSTWETRFATPILARTRAGHVGSIPASLAGKGYFDAIRRALANLNSALSGRLASARERLSSDARLLQSALLIAAALILGSVLGAGLLLRRIITRPLQSLGRDAERVAAGDFGRGLAVVDGPREVVQLGDEIEAMRRRIVLELETVERAREALQAQAQELTRSNAELEQFAYVASHDLQEPLRKIASFCQALERRYQGQLDERADQYIAFAVDGAKRMQILINDLLAFSRVGRGGREHELVDLGELVARTETALSRMLSDTAATVLGEQELPVVRGERALLESLFQNLITNAVKFRAEEPPVVRFAAWRDGDQWVLSCTDNGIGIDAEYAERIFVIFQRLHTKEAYPGTGIGLAMCRKIVEYHGGRMWLNAEHRPGAQLCFTLPISEEEKP